MEPWVVTGSKKDPIKSITLNTVARFLIRLFAWVCRRGRWSPVQSLKNRYCLPGQLLRLKNDKWPRKTLLNFYRILKLESWEFFLWSSLPPLISVDDNVVGTHGLTFGRCERSPDICSRTVLINLESGTGLFNRLPIKCVNWSYRCGGILEHMTHV